MINQRAYPDIKLGNSNYTIATDGCYLSSIQQGLKLRGYIYTIKELNDLFKEKGVFPAGSGLLSSATIAAKVPSIFLEGRNEAWNDKKLMDYLADDQYLIVGEVSGKGIGGTAQHFVYIDSIDVHNGQITMTYIDDSWDGLENQKVTTRYNAYGNILSLRVFKLVKKGNQQMPANMYEPEPGSGHKYDLTNIKSNQALADLHYNVVIKQTHITKEACGALVEAKNKECENKLSERDKEWEKAVESMQKTNDAYVTKISKEIQYLEEFEASVVKILADNDWTSVSQIQDFIVEAKKKPATTTQIDSSVKLSSLISEVLRRILAGNWS